jgi:hypothetical protein
MVSKKVSAAIHLGLAALLPLFLFLLCTSIIGPIRAQSGSQAGSQAATQTSSPEREQMAREYVAKALKTWQTRLNLDKWKITADLVRSTALEPKTLGNVHWDTTVKEASISVLSTYDYKLPTQEMLDDMEFTVVHELLHIHLASLPHSAASRSPEEQAVNELARAFLKLAKK